MARIKTRSIAGPQHAPESAMSEPAKEDKPAKSREYATFGNVRILKYPDPDPHFTPRGEIYKVDPNNNILERVAWAVNAGKDVLLRGDTGTGKTSLIRFLAQECNASYVRFPCSDATDAAALVGQMLIGDKGTYFQKGIAYDALENGKWLNLDEVNAALPEVRLRLNSIYRVDEGNLTVPENEGEVIHRHKNFRLFATMNPLSYAGTKAMNEAIMSRFDVVVDVGYLPSELEAELLTTKVPVKADLAEKMVRAANKVRQARKTDEAIRFPFSFRELENWAAASRRFGVAEAAEFTVIGKCEEEDRDPVRNLLKGQFAQSEWKP